jgi:hypothetical protein
MMREPALSDPSAKANRSIVRMIQPWKATELEFHSNVEYANALEDVRVRVTFTGPHKERLERDAFWDGGTRWLVRFAAPTGGIWEFRSEASDRRNTGLHGVTGQLLCASASSGASVHKHGFLEPSPSGTHLRNADGTPFFWLADTHWRFAWEHWDESNKPGWSSQFRDTVDLRVRQGFTVYQCNLLSWSPPEFWDRFEAGDGFDVDFFREIVDPRLAYVADSGLVLALGLAWYHAVDAKPERMVELARYVVARYGAYPMVWTLGGEVAGYEPELRRSRLDAWSRVARAIAAADCYSHPITAHLTCERPMPSEFQDEPWLTFALSQLGHGDLDMGSGHWRNHLADHPGKPLIEGESFYEGLTSVEPTARRPVTDTMVRQVAYRAIQSGCCGYSYGAQGCWNGAWDADTSRSMWGETPWHAGVDLPGAAQMGHLRRFYETIPWTALAPTTDLFATTDWVNATMYTPHVSADVERSTVVVYFGETYRHDEGIASINDLQAATYQINWFDPREGRFLGGSPQDATGDRSISVPPPPSCGTDWVLLARVD